MRKFEIVLSILCIGILITLIFIGFQLMKMNDSLDGLYDVLRLMSKNR
ncbi:hypothetical protein [Niallia sp. 03133]